MLQKFNVGFCTFSYGGNGGIASEVPAIREWMVPLVADLAKDERVANIRIWNIADTPVTMSRNKAVLDARQFGLDVLVMIDSDMTPDLYLGVDPAAKPFFQSSFDFLVKHYHLGPCVIGAPYCGPPPHECVYVFEWRNLRTDSVNPDFQLKMYERSQAAKMAGIQECAALPTGLIMYDMRAFEVTEPKNKGDKPWFYYEFPDIYESQKASTEDVTMTRDLSLVGTQKLGYNPVMCNWDAWAGHHKPLVVGKPSYVPAKDISSKLRQSWEAAVDPDVKTVDLRPAQSLENFLQKCQQKAEGFVSMGMDLPPKDVEGIHKLIQYFRNEHGRKPRVLEIGSWAGRSAIEMCKAGAESVHCVDTWEGSKNDAGTSAYDGSLGTPFEVFQRNVAQYPITWTKGRSPDVAREFHDGGYDIVYIDAEHDKESVLADIKAWKPKAKHMLSGHDYVSFQGVRLACMEAGLNPWVIGNVWHERL